jgi:metal-responsive CopG/Arc/MetJ family transcriptional regulator
MKTAISIPDPLFHSAEIMAHHLAISRSELFTKAISEYLEAHKYQDVTESLNQVYTKLSSSLDEELASMQLDSIGKEIW